MTYMQVCWFFCLIKYSVVVVQSLSCVDSLRPHRLQHARIPYPSPTPGAYSNSCPWSEWYHPAISSSVISFSSSLQSFPASGSFPVSRLFASRDQSIGASSSASVLPMNIQGWFSLGLTGLIFLSWAKKEKKVILRRGYRIEKEHVREVRHVLGRIYLEKWWVCIHQRSYIMFTGDVFEDPCMERIVWGQQKKMEHGSYTRWLWSLRSIQPSSKRCPYSY